MIAPGPRLALLLLGSYRKLVDAAVRELDARGFADVRPALHYAMTAIELGADSGSELGRSLSVTKQAAAKTIAILTERGWVAASPDTVDRRRNRLMVTELGRRVMREGEQIFDELRQAWRDEIGTDELAALEERLAEFVGDDGVRLDSPGWVGQDGA